EHDDVGFEEELPLRTRRRMNAPAPLPSRTHAQDACLAEDVCAVVVRILEIRHVEGVLRAVVAPGDAVAATGTRGTGSPVVHGGGRKLRRDAKPCRGA